MNEIRSGIYAKSIGKETYGVVVEVNDIDAQLTELTGIRYWHCTTITYGNAIQHTFLHSTMFIGKRKIVIKPGDSLSCKEKDLVPLDDPYQEIEKETDEKIPAIDG